MSTHDHDHINHDRRNRGCGARAQNGGDPAGAGRSYLPHRVLREDRPDGTILLRSPYTLGEVAGSTGEWLHRWARQAPDRVFIAERSGDGWREHGYAEMLQMVRAVAASLLARGVGRRPVAILSGNSVDHAILALAAQYVGAPVVPLAEQYALIPAAHGRLRYLLEKVRPALVYVADAGRFAPALALDCLRGVDVVAGAAAGGATGVGSPVTPFAELLNGGAGRAETDPQLAAAHGCVGPDTLAKILFTSGSTSQPKGVRTTQRMLCVNQAQLLATLPFLGARPPRVLDWLPWHHVFGGSHNFNMMLANGGSYFIDEGRPTADGFAATLRNLRDRPGTLSFNVPAGYALLLDALRGDEALRRCFFADLDMIFYAGASLPQPLWEGLEHYALQQRGTLPLMNSSWGMTETAPATLIVHEPTGRSGVVGVPVPGVTAKLLPGEDLRCELRVTGPNVTDGYFDDPARSAEAFDEEGFLITGDMVRFADPADPAAGLVFDGRLSEDFKLLTGTWVHAPQLRLTALSAFAGLAQDLVVCGQDRAEIGVLVFPAPQSLAALGITPPDDAEGAALADDALRERVGGALRQLAAQATGSSTRIARALVLAEPPSLAGHEITAKGNLNMRQVLTRRAALVERLYDDNDPACVRL